MNDMSLNCNSLSFFQISNTFWNKIYIVDTDYQFLFSKLSVLFITHQNILCSSKERYLSLKANLDILVSYEIALRYHPISNLMIMQGFYVCGNNANRFLLDFRYNRIKFKFNLNDDE